MKTRGTRNLHLLSDADLQSMIAASGLDVYEAATVFREEALVDFALETLHKFTAERDRRKGGSSLVPTSLRDTKIGLLG